MSREALSASETLANIFAPFVLADVVLSAGTAYFCNHWLKKWGYDLILRVPVTFGAFYCSLVYLYPLVMMGGFSLVCSLFPKPKKKVKKVKRTSLLFYY